jgi:hypothetical protein
VSLYIIVFRQLRAMIITYTCPSCGEETEFEDSDRREVLRKISVGSPKVCSNKRCKKAISRTVLPKHFYENKEFKDKTYDHKKDRYATLTQLYSAQEIAQRFNIAMRLDPVVPGTSNVGSVVHVYPCHPRAYWGRLDVARLPSELRRRTSNLQMRLLMPSNRSVSLSGPSG